MSRPLPELDRKPMIGLVGRVHREMRADMLGEAHRRGYTFIRQAHNDVFATLPLAGARASDMAARAGITRQSMGEIIRELVELGLLEMQPDPTDGRAKVVTFTEAGLELTRGGLEHIIDLEQALADELGAEDYETARRVLEGIVRILGERAADPA
jgi:DNA-binding MarR family transcriptional regulator